jgi:glutaredoxin
MNAIMTTIRRAVAPLLLAGTMVTGCSARDAAPTADAGAPALTVVTADRKDLLFRYRAEDGSFATATSVGEVPDGARGAVQVVDLARSPDERAAAKYVQVFDLRHPGSDGRFPGKVVPRAELEQALAARAETPKQAAVTMYSASWCGVCRKARKFLGEQGIAFVEKDVEKDAGAADELARKARAAGVDVGGVPVFDVGGHILSGFDPDGLLRAVRGG